MKIEKGKLIVIEGNEEAGKATQGKLLSKRLIKNGIKSVYLSFPMYDTPTGKILYNDVLGKDGKSLFPEEATNLDPYIACLYYAADRKYNINKIEEYINDGYVVILDRYISSNMAHQGGKILDKEERFNMFQWIDRLEYWLLRLPKPDLTIYMHLPYKEEIYGIENKDYLENSCNAYQELASLYNWDTVNCLEFGSRKKEQALNDEIYKILEKKFD